MSEPHTDSARGGADSAAATLIDARKNAQRAARSNPVTQVAKLAATPTGLLIAIPLLVLLVGAIVAVNSYLNMRGSIAEMGAVYFAEVTRAAAEQTKTCLDQAPDLLERLAMEVQRDSTLSAQTLGPALAPILASHKGVSWLSVSEPDGHFVGVLVEDDGTIRVNESWADKERLQRFVMEDGRPILLMSEKTSYDPRKRPFYALALSAEGSQWTAPYVFFNLGLPGISATRALYDADGKLLGVLTVDFDLQTLSMFVAGLRDVEAATLFLYDDQSLLLAHSSLALVAERGRGDEGALIRAQDYPDEGLRAFLEAVAALPDESSDQTGPVRFEVSGEPYLGSRSVFKTLLGTRWTVGAVVREEVLMGDVRQSNTQSILITILGLLIAGVIAGVFARRVSLMRRSAMQATVDAADARREALELGSYRLVRKLGQGGMGEVWEAEHRMLARPVAIKIVKRSVLALDSEGSEHVLERFRREAQASARLHSRNTIEIFDFGVNDEGMFYYVMELLHGVDLHSLVATMGPLPAARVVYLLRQVCESLREAHRVGLVHRDIKPANLYLARCGLDLDVVKVLDFGLVTTHQPSQTNADEPRLTEPLSLTGTPGYMAPEAARGEAATPAADIYSVGCVAYWLLTGRTLFDDENTITLILKHQNEPALHLDTLVAGLPDGLSRLVMSCLEKHPEMRPRSCDELRDRLDEIALACPWTTEDMEQWWDSFDGATADSAAVVETLGNFTLHKRSL